MILKKLTLNQIINMHESLTQNTGGSAGIRDRGLLESALSAPFATFGGVYLYPTIQAQAARLAYGIVSNHPFIDGNKRIGVLTLLTFLKENGILLDCTNEDLIKLGLSLADGTYDENDVLEFILKHEICTQTQ